MGEKEGQLTANDGVTKKGKEIKPVPLPTPDIPRKRKEKQSKPKLPGKNPGNVEKRQERGHEEVNSSGRCLPERREKGAQKPEREPGASWWSWGGFCSRF